MSFIILEKSETKEKGRILFELIEDVFSDHLKALKVCGKSLVLYIGPI